MTGQAASARTSSLEMCRHLNGHVLLRDVEARLGMAGPLTVRLSDDCHPRRPKTKSGQLSMNLTMDIFR